jgi:hypothetical protein
MKPIELDGFLEDYLALNALWPRAVRTTTAWPVTSSTTGLVCSGPS